MALAPLAVAPVDRESSNATPRMRLRASLLRVDAATRTRVAKAGEDAEHAVVDAAARVEARAIGLAREGLRSNAWLAMGVALGLGIVLGTRSR